MEQEYKWMVCTRCWTYNHAPYINDALNGFTMQETTFPYVCVIVDDASTDGEQEVIKKYLQEHFDLEDTSIVRNEETEDYTLTFARHKTNKNCHFAVLYLKYNHYSIKKSKAPYLKEWQDKCKYIAACEGDDYWIVPNKLQKQIDIMENDSECHIALSNGISHNYRTGKSRMMNPLPAKTSGFISIHEIFKEKGGLIPTASMCFRGEIYDRRPLFVQKAPVGDRPTRMWCAIHGKVYYDTEPQLVHRQFVPGSYGTRSHANNKLAHSVYERMIVFLDEFDRYTHGEYHSDVQYMKEREEFAYYSKIGDKKAMLNSRYFKHRPFKQRLSIYMKMYFPRLYGQFRALSKN